MIGSLFEGQNGLFASCRRGVILGRGRCRCFYQGDGRVAPAAPENRGGFFICACARVGVTFSTTTQSYALFYIFAMGDDFNIANCASRQAAPGPPLMNGPITNRGCP